MGSVYVCVVREGDFGTVSLCAQLLWELAIKIYGNIL